MRARRTRGPFQIQGWTSRRRRQIKRMRQLTANFQEPMRLRVSPEKLRSIANRCEYPEDFLRRITREFGVPTNRGIDDDAYLHGLKWGLRGLDSRRQGSGVSAEFRQGHKDGVLARSHLLRNDGAWFNRALEVNL